MANFLHIIAFDIPYPPNYGGAIDVFFRIKALSENGIKVILHCFEYNRKQPYELDKLCYKVYYYKRKSNLLSHFSYLPYTVFSRRNKTLLANLKLDNYPILFEGLMSCYYLNSKELTGRFKVYREANIEHQYYHELYKATQFSTSKLYYLAESIKFRFFERNLHKVQLILAISEVDTNYYASKFKDVEVDFVPCFHSNHAISIRNEVGDYLLYHGNLSVPENEKSAIYLCQHVFSKLSYKCVITGMNPTDKLIRCCSELQNVTLIANPTDEQLKKLICDAQVNLLVTFQSTGLKIKLLNTLFAGKHVVVNNKMLVGSGLNVLCEEANTAENQIELCKKLMNLPFTTSDIEKREAFLMPHFSNNYLSEKIIQLLYK